MIMLLWKTQENGAGGAKKGMRRSQGPGIRDAEVGLNGQDQAEAGWRLHRDKARVVVRWWGVWAAKQHELLLLPLITTTCTSTKVD